VVFGLVHLWFREFPNWQFAVIAGVAGVFYGLAYVASGGIRAAMVTHALVVATWRTFLA
jgi:membrane protease YdiL (CAAX protease family)